MRKALIAAAVMMAAGLALAAGRPGILNTREGGVYDGTIDERDDGTVVVNVRGIETSIPREQVASITYGEFETRWNEQYAKLAATDASGRVGLARRAFEERRYDLAERALRDALTIEPNSAEAAELLKLTISQRRLERNAVPVEGAVAGAVPAIKPPSPWKLLSAEQINRIKQVEFQPSDTQVRVNFKNNVLKKYHDANPNLGMNFTQFQRLPLAERAAEIITKGGELSKDVEVVTDPSPLLTFRRDVLPLVLAGCATSACHGGNNAATKNFALVTPAADAAAIYTNFYVLQSYKKTLTAPAGGAEAGMFDPGAANMINRTQAGESLLLQYALPEQIATSKHPRVRGYNGTVRTVEDPKYRTIAAFIQSLNQLEPDYGISFKLMRTGGELPAQPENATPTVTQPSR